MDSIEKQSQKYSNNLLINRQKLLKTIYTIRFNPYSVFGINALVIDVLSTPDIKHYPYEGIFVLNYPSGDSITIDKENLIKWLK